MNRFDTSGEKFGTDLLELYRQAAEKSVDIGLDMAADNNTVISFQEAARGVLLRRFQRMVSGVVVRVDTRLPHDGEETNPHPLYRRTLDTIRVKQYRTDRSTEGGMVELGGARTGQCDWLVGLVNTSLSDPFAGTLAVDVDSRRADEVLKRAPFSAVGDLRYVGFTQLIEKCPGGDPTTPYHYLASIKRVR